MQGEHEIAPKLSNGTILNDPDFITQRQITQKRYKIEVYLASKSGVTLKTGLGFIQGHWKWHHLIDRIRVPIHLS